MSVPFLREDDLPPGEAREVTLPGGGPVVRRLLCDNPSPYTFRGTNTWIIGRGEVVVLDPGPDDASHTEAILRATRGERIARILVSHTHRDHSSGAAALARATGARTAGFGPHLTPPEAGGDGADHDFRPDERLADGDALSGGDASSGEWRLAALHTPGHCGNHLCFALDGTGMLFSGDHVMAWSTSVVSPPDGDMGDYVASLDRVARRRDRLLLPGHGPPLPEPASFLAALAAHRRAREARVLEALRAAGGPVTAEDLVPAAYGPGLDPELRGAAARSLLAQLLELRRQGAARREGDRFSAV